MNVTMINDLLALNCVQELLTAAGKTTEGFREELEKELPKPKVNLSPVVCDIDELLKVPYIQDLLENAGHKPIVLREELECHLPRLTPNANWMVNGEPDPFEGRYNCLRDSLPMGEMSDYEFANNLYLFGDEQPQLHELLAGTKKRPIVWLTAAKDRIRWLSFQLALAHGYVYLKEE